jgi:hypothetical protein
VGSWCTASHILLWRRVASGEWRVASGKWRVASGEWRVASGEWRVANVMVLLSLPTESEDPAVWTKFSCLKSKSDRLSFSLVTVVLTIYRKVPKLNFPKHFLQKPPNPKYIIWLLSNVVIKRHPALSLVPEFPNYAEYLLHLSVCNVGNSRFVS